MIRVQHYKDKTVAVMGLGRSGMATAVALKESGSEVWAWDDSAKARKALTEIGLEPRDLNAADFSGVAVLVWSPGIAHTWPKRHPIAQKAEEAGTEIVCDIELLSRAQPKAHYIGITGTNGKSTTTALIGHILRHCGVLCEVGGNIGNPALDLKPLGEQGTYVLEMSSYQLELIPTLAFEISVLLNVSPDHLDRHGGMAGYIDAKERIFARTARAVVGVNDEPGRKMAAELKKRRTPVTPIQIGAVALKGLSVDAGKLYENGKEIADLNGMETLPGAHNWQNAAAAFAVARGCGLSDDAILAAMATFPGLAHRQERVAEIDGILFVNDSKGTNAEATERALACYDAVYWIAGGQAKEGGITALEPYFGRIKHAFLIGEAANLFAKTLGEAVPHTLSLDLDTAVAQAWAMAKGDKGSVVLLSPACASWDQFKNFEERGEVFRKAVRAIERQEGAA